MKLLPLAPVLALLLPAGCARAPRPAAPAPLPTPAATATTPTPASVPGDPATLPPIVAQAAAREWTVRAVTLGGDTLVGRISRPTEDRLRVRLRDLAYGDLRSLERKEERDGGLYETRLLAGAAVGAMGGLVAGTVAGFSGDLETGHPVRWMIPGAMVGLLVGALGQSPGAPTTWVPLWRRP